MLPPVRYSLLVCLGCALFWSPLPIFDRKSLEQAWITLTLDAAIGQLRRQGFTRGFTSLTVMRPLHPRISDECTFVFKCPPDQAFVGISAQTGKWLWTEAFPHRGGGRRLSWGTGRPESWLSGQGTDDNN